MGNPTLTPTMLTKEEILNYHRSFLCSLDILGSSLNPIRMGSLNRKVEGISSHLSFDFDLPSSSVKVKV
jgi:hypothetical protein